MWREWERRSRRAQVIRAFSDLSQLPIHFGNLWPHVAIELLKRELMKLRCAVSVKYT